MKESLSLARCKPLSDPVRVFANVVPIWSMVASIVTILLVGGYKHSKGEDVGAILSFLTLLVALSMPLGIWFFFRTANRKPVIYLRAFKSDRPARRLRSLLKAALGSDFRLCGIRPPRERSHLLTRLLAANLVIFRYAGSENFELEADDRDWMARLLSTYARSAFVFVDLRDLTEHVEDEIRLSYLAMGLQRCVFLIDSKRTKAEWLQLLHAVLEGEVTKQADFIFLEYPGDEKVDAKIFITEARSVIDQLPSDPVVISDEAVAFAKERVGEQNWQTSFWHAGDLKLSYLIFAVGAALSLAVSYFSGQLGPFVILPVIIGVATWAMFFVAWGRAWQQGEIDKRFRRPGTRSPHWRLGFSLLLVLLSPAYLLMGGIFKLHQVADEARHLTVEADIQAIKTQLQLYESMNGFFPTTEQGLQTLVTQPQTDPKPARWDQLFTKLPKDPWGSDYIYRNPGLKNPGGYDLYSAGPDRLQDTNDDDWGETSSLDLDAPE
jgi:general secretion pathway protein G